jgi:hypothetical protein
MSCQQSHILHSSELSMFRAVIQVTTSLPATAEHTSLYIIISDGGTYSVTLRCVSIAVSILHIQRRHEKSKRISLIVSAVSVENGLENYVTSVLLCCTDIAVSTSDIAVSTTDIAVSTTDNRSVTPQYRSLYLHLSDKPTNTHYKYVQSHTAILHHTFRSLQ